VEAYRNFDTGASLHQKPQNHGAARIVSNAARKLRQIANPLDAA